MNNWPTDPTDIVKEALREYVGDGEGEDDRVLDQHNARVVSEALEAFAEYDVEGRDYASELASRLNSHGFLHAPEFDGDAIDPITVIREYLADAGLLVIPGDGEMRLALDMVLGYPHPERLDRAMSVIAAHVAEEKRKTWDEGWAAGVQYHESDGFDDSTLYNPHEVS